MSDLTTLREALTDLLNGTEDAPTGVRAVTYIPQTFTPPICWVTAGSPYRQHGQTFGDKRVRLSVVCFGGLSTNDAAEAATEDLAELVADLIDAPGQTAFMLDPVAELDQPRLYPSAQGQQMLGIAVNVIGRSVRG